MKELNNFYIRKENLNILQKGFSVHKSRNA